MWPPARASAQLPESCGIMRRDGATECEWVARAKVDSRYVESMHLEAPAGHPTPHQFNS